MQREVQRGIAEIGTAVARDGGRNAGSPNLGAQRFGRQAARVGQWAVGDQRAAVAFVPRDVRGQVQGHGLDFNRVVAPGPGRSRIT